MGSTNSTDMDHVVHLIRILFWNMITGSQLLTHIPGKLNEEADKSQGSMKLEQSGW